MHLLFLLSVVENVDKKKSKNQKLCNPTTHQATLNILGHFLPDLCICVFLQE